MRPHDELSFPTRASAGKDGVSLFYRHWPAAESPSRGAIVILHRGHEHSGRVAHLADELALPGFDVFAWDAPRPRPARRARAATRRASPPWCATSDAFVAHIGTAHGFAAENTEVVAQSVGAVVAATWVHDYAPKIRALVLASPAFRVRLYVPFARPGLRLLRRLRGNFDVQSYVKARDADARSGPRRLLRRRSADHPGDLGRHPASAERCGGARRRGTPRRSRCRRSSSCRGPTMSSRPGRSTASTSGSAAAPRNATCWRASITTPSANSAGRRPSRRCAASWSSASTGPWSGRRCRTPTATATRVPRPTASPRRCRRCRHGDCSGQGTRAGLKLGGKLSEGVALGHATGFDSGATLDYV